MDTMFIIGLVVLVVFVLAIAYVVRMGWRLLRHNEELVSGGSWGNQVFGRRKQRKPNGAKTL
jgi:hypothetical protein